MSNINLSNKDLQHLHSVWIVITNHKCKPKIKRGELLNDEKEFLNVKVDGKIIKVKEAFSGIKEALDKCKEIEEAENE